MVIKEKTFVTDRVKPNQLPAGSREKRPIGRLFSSFIYLKFNSIVVLTIFVFVYRVISI